MFKKLRLTLVLILFAILSYAQPQGHLIIKGSIKVDREVLSGAKVHIYEDGKEVQVLVADNGKVEAELKLNKEYDVIVKKIGFFDKKLSFNTSVPKEDQDVYVYRFSMEMLREVDGFDESFWDDPVGKIMFVYDIGEFDYDEEYTKRMQARLKEMMKQYQKLLAETYKKILAQADDAYNNGDYDLAEELYNKAIEYDPYDPYPDDQMAAIGKIRAEEKNDQKNYDKYVELADGYYDVKDYENAKSNYEKALKVKDSEQYPKDQLVLISAILNNQEQEAERLAALNRSYNEAIIKGEQAFSQKNYEVALKGFTKATEIKPDQQYPKDKIREINLLKKEQSDATARLAALEQQYKSLIAQADAAFGAKKYSEARGKYEEAGQLKRQEAYPPQKIAEIDGILSAMRGREVKYKGFITLADEAYDDRRFSEARDNYALASKVKPEEAYPKDRVAEIDAMLAAAAKKRTEEMNARYKAAIAKGDVAFESEKYTEAKEAYGEALKVKANEQYPKDRIAEIDKIVNTRMARRMAYEHAISKGDNAYNASGWQTARDAYAEALKLYPEEAYPQTRIAELDKKLLAMKEAQEMMAAREKSYNEAIQQGDALYAEKKYLEAKNSYNQALNVKPSESYPVGKIKEIDGILAAQKLLDKNYSDHLVTGNQLFMEMNYSKAKLEFQKAAELKPQEEYPREMISELDGLIVAAQKQRAEAARLQKQYEELLARADAQFDQKAYKEALASYQEALTIFTEEHPQQRVKEINNIFALAEAKEREYEAAITKGDGLFASKSYSQSIAAYKQALEIKAGEAYPQQQIDAANAAIKQQEDLQTAYENLIQEADLAYSNKKFQIAVETYTKALDLKPNEAYPQKKIEEINVYIAELIKQRAEQERLEKEYAELIASADEDFSQKKYTEAKELYQRATRVKAEETYPKQQVIEIERILKQETDKRIAYEAMIDQAKAAETAKNYNGAIKFYRDALKIKPQELLPKQKIEELTGIVADNLRKQNEYNSFIADGDRLFAGNQLVDAKNNYQKALAVLPNEAYPGGQIQKIDQLLADEAKQIAEQEAIDKAYGEKISQADNAYDAQDYEAAIAQYKAALAIKPGESYPSAQIRNCMAKQRKREEALASETIEQEQDEQLAAGSGEESVNGKEFDYAGQKRDQRFLSDLAKQYPEGKTVENYKKPNKTIKRIIINKNGIAKEYLEVHYSYGTYYFRNGSSISRSIFYSETK